MREDRVVELRHPGPDFRRQRAPPDHHLDLRIGNAGKAGLAVAGDQAFDRHVPDIGPRAMEARGGRCHLPVNSP